MEQVKVLSFIRQVLSFVGAWLIGKQFLGNTIDDSILEGLIGVVLTIVGLVWGIRDKTAGIEMWQSAVRHVIATIGGLLVSSGRLSDMALEQISGIVLFIIPLIQGLLSRTKVAQLAAGEIHVHSLKGAEDVSTKPRETKIN